MNVADTNVWIYSYDTREPSRQQTARNLIVAIAPLVLPWQVGCEFLAASRKLLPTGFTTEMAWQALSHMRNMSSMIALPDPADWDLAREMQTRDMLSFWDALLLGTCLRHGITTLYTEDMGSPRTIRGVRLINPFATP